MKRLLAMLTLVLSPAAMAADIEEPQWELIDKLDAVELRLYQPSIQAVTELRSSAGTSAGFRRLAGYIFGGNEQAQSIAMTAPVQETLDKGAPVMAFTLPAEYTLDELPVPNDARVSIVTRYSLLTVWGIFWILWVQEKQWNKFPSSPVLTLS